MGSQERQEAYMKGMLQAQYEMTDIINQDGEATSIQHTLQGWHDSIADRGFVLFGHKVARRDAWKAIVVLISLGQLTKI